MLDELRVKIFADGADLESIRRAAEDPRIRGFTTNPTLMRQAGVADYEAFARDVIALVPDRSLSLEVFSDDEAEMEEQALKIASWGERVSVKIPVTDTRGTPTTGLVRRLASQGVSLNVTALMTLEQVATVVEALRDGPGGFVSLFAGRIADSGRDPVPYVSAAAAIVHTIPGLELIWASPREVLNVVQADRCGCDVITMTPDLLAKLRNLGRDLIEYSLDTVRMFRDDAVRAGYRL